MAAKMKAWTDWQFREAIRTSSSIGEVLSRLGRKKTGGNRLTVKRAIVRLGVSIAHFTPVGQGKRGLTKYFSKKALPLNQIFRKDSQAQRRDVIKLIHRYNLLPYRCEEPKCGLKNLWRGKNLVLQLEHKNGVRNDHRLTNICWLCPNCHSQTDTYAGRARAPNRWKNGRRLDFRRTSPKRFRPQLHRADHQAVIARFIIIKNYSAVGREFGISDNAVKKIVSKSGLNLRSSAKQAGWYDRKLRREESARSTKKSQSKSDRPRPIKKKKVSKVP